MAQKPKKDINEVLVTLADESHETEGQSLGKIDTILKLFNQGYSRVEIVAAGFNRTTVYRQVGEYLKLLKAPALEFRGYSLYEARVQRFMKAKGLDREAAETRIMELDFEAMEKPEEMGLLPELDEDFDPQDDEEENSEED